MSFENCRVEVGVGEAANCRVEVEGAVLWRLPRPHLPRHSDSPPRVFPLRLPLTPLLALWRAKAG